MAESYLITGGAGFIGSNIARSLTDGADRVRVLDNLSTGRESNLNGIDNDIEFIRGDIRDMDVVRRAVKGMDYVYHQAALPSVPRSIEDPVSSTESNIVGTLNVLLASRDAGVRRVIYAGSSSAYGETPELPKREDMLPDPLSPYALTKLTGEYYCRIFSRLYGLETVTLRYFNVFGPRQDPASQYAAVIPKFIRCLLDGDRPTIYGDGEQTRDFTYVENVVEGNRLAARAEKTGGEIINLATSDRISLNRLVDLLVEITGRSITPIHAEARRGDVKHSLADITRAGDLLGYEPLVDLREGLRRTVEWMRAGDVSRRGTE